MGTGLELANAHQDWPETKKYQLEPAQSGKYWSGISFASSKELPNTRKLWVLVFPRAEEKLEPPQAMNALMKLNQLKPGLQYKLVSQTGPVHAPIFTMSVEIDGSTFEASGPSKKTAKLHVAVKVSAGFAGNGNGKTAHPTRDRVGAAPGTPSPECPWSARGIGERRAPERVNRWPGAASWRVVPSGWCSSAAPDLPPALQVLQDMGLPTGVEGKDSGKGDESAEETETKPVVVAPPPVVETVSTPTAASPPSDQTPEVGGGTWDGAHGSRAGGVCPGRSWLKQEAEVALRGSFPKRLRSGSLCAGDFVGLIQPLSSCRT